MSLKYEDTVKIFSGIQTIYDSPLKIHMENISIGST